MFNVQVVGCTGVGHKVACLNEAIAAVRAARTGNETRNGRKVSIRGAITDPCTCHLDALIWLASDVMNYTDNAAEAWCDGVWTGVQRAEANRMH